jgi:hypothetical protein
MVHYIITLTFLGFFVGCSSPSTESDTIVDYGKLQYAITPDKIIPIDDYDSL